MTSTLTLVVSFIFQLLCLLFWIRFLLQAAQADFYNPLSQAVANATDTVCKPLRMVLPSLGRFDIASVVVAVLISIAGVALTVWLEPNFSGAPGRIIMLGIVQSFMVLTNFFLFSIFIIIIASFIAPGGGNHNPALLVLQQILEPVMGPIRRIIPPLGPFDLSPMVVILLIFIIQGMLANL